MGSPVPISLATNQLLILPVINKLGKLNYCYKMSDWSPEYNTDYAHLASGTFSGYITGTVKLVAIVWFIFMLLSVLTSMLMGYAIYGQAIQNYGIFQSTIETV